MLRLKHVEYHSKDWEILVEIGWITVCVDYNNIATMLYHKEGNYGL